MRFLLSLLLGAHAFAASFPELHLTPVAEGLEQPTAITHAGDGSGRIYIVEQPGRIRILRDGAVQPRPLLDITDRVRSGGERGLLSVAFPRAYAEKRYFYVNYTDQPGGNTVVSRFRLTADPEVADPASEQVLLRIVQPYANHNGGMMAFSPQDGRLYIGMGDGGSGGDPQNYAQNPASLLGKMLRLDVEGGSNGENRAEIWASGLRNPWKFSFDRATGDLWIADVGQNRAEEVNFQPAGSNGGENYGWRRMEGLQCFDANCDRAGLTLPVFEYGRGLGCSVTGGYVYRGARWPALEGSYLFADYCTGNIWAMRGQAEGFASSLLLRSGLNVATFGEDERGELYLADHSSGRIFLIGAGAPEFAAAGVVNGASFLPGITPGSIATVFGRGIAPVNGVVAASTVPLPRQLAGVQVLVDGIEAPLFAVANVNGAEQINFQVPWESEGRLTAQISVRNNGRESATVEVQLARRHAGKFVVVGRGEFATFYMTGLGAVERAPATGEAAPLEPLSRTLFTPEVTFKGFRAEVLFSGLAPGMVGVYQIDVKLPPEYLQGCTVP